MEFRTLFAAVSLLAAFVEVTAENYGNCKPIYRRYSDSYTGCQPSNKQCKIVAHGAHDEATKKEILRVHNELRSVIAKQKHGNKGLPPAADMMEMEWDNELSNVAQRRAEQCIYAHDDDEQRIVQRFVVGQNIGIAKDRPAKTLPDWEGIIKSFYEEIEDYDADQRCKDLADEANFEEIGHFTQVIWAKTFKVGCGYTQYHDENGYTSLYYCNYGPAGNIKHEHECIYEEGRACSKCPKNTKCDGNTGLCKRINNDVTPIYPSQVSYIFNCNFRNPSSKGDCGVHRKGDNPDGWKTVRGLQYDYLENVLQPGENATIIFAKKVAPPQNSGSDRFCVALRYRKGPVLAKDKTEGENRAVLFVSPDIPNQNPRELQEFEFDEEDTPIWRYMSTDLLWKFPTQLKISFAVPEDATAQYINIAYVRAYDGECTDEKDIKAN